MTATLKRSKSATQSPGRLETISLVIAIHGPPGSTGKSSFAFNLAYEFAELGKRVCLIDLDTHAPSLASLVGYHEPPVGLSGCSRLIRQGRFNLEQFERLSVLVRHRRASFRVLTGVPASRRWHEVSEDTVQHLLTLTRAEFDITILDLSTPLDSELFSTANSLPRNVATISALKRCDLVISVLLETPLSLSRYLGQSLELQEINPQRKIVINRSTRQAAYSEVLRTLTKESIFATIPDDQPAFQLAESESLPLALARRKSAARTSVALIANKLLECPPLGN